MKKLSLLLLATLTVIAGAFARAIVKGRVVDKNNLPLPGVSVKIKGTTAGTATDNNGYYNLSVKDAGTTLVFSCVGFEEQEMAVGSAATTDVQLKESVATADVAVVGSRSPKRSATETPSPVDIIPVSRVANQLGQVDINQLLQFAAPSFNSNRQSGADGADHVDPASLRGLGPDQTLVLINGKRRHQSSLVNIYGSRGRGNTGTDLNTIPAAAIERIEILRDGASAQYGSDAIAGVINIILKSNATGVTANVMTGTNVTGYGSSLNSEKGKVIRHTIDGAQVNANVNYGIKVGYKGFANFTADFLYKNKTHRPALASSYPDNYRMQFGDASYNNYSLVANSMMPVSATTNVYLFATISSRNGDAFAWTRDAESDRNIKSIYPEGFDPHIQSKINDGAISGGIRTKLGGWNADFNITTGANRFKYEVDKTLNASLGDKSPTHFDAGGYQLSQTRIGADVARAFANVAAGLNLAFGAEMRREQYKIFQGEERSWKSYGAVYSINPGDTTLRPAGAQGFPGFQPKDETNQHRESISAYADAELDITQAWLVSGAVRMENYSDFGFTHNYKLASRLKLGNKFMFRGSASTGFRAPSLPQINYSATFTNVVAGKLVDQVIAPNSGSLARAIGIPELKQETSVNLSIGFTAKPVKNMNLTFDAYQVTIKDRVVLTGLFGDDDDAIGNVLQTMNVGAAQFFTNAVDTRTQGIDVVATYSNPLGTGRLNTSFAANFNKMNIQKIKTTDKLAGKEDTYFDDREQAFLLASAPAHKMNLGFDYRIKNFNITLRFTNFSSVKLVDWSYDTKLFKGKTTTDFSAGYTFEKKYTFTISGTNIFDVYSTRVDPAVSETGGMFEAIQMGYGGAFFFGRISVKL